MKVSVDRLEGSFAVVELPDGSFAELPVSLVPDVREGDVVDVRIDAEETRRRRENAATLTKKLFGE